MAFIKNLGKASIYVKGNVESRVSAGTKNHERWAYSIYTAASSRPTFYKTHLNKENTDVIWLSPWDKYIITSDLQIENIKI